MPNYRALIKRAARKYGVTPAILVAQIGAESNFDPDAVSPVGARGIAQFMPGTAKSYGVDLDDGDARDDIDGAARFMRDNLRRFGGNYRKALAAYNAGPGAVEKYGGVPPYAETQAYVKKILDAAGGSERPGTPSKVNDGIVFRPGRVETVTDEAARKSAIIDYFNQRGKPGALIDLVSGLRDAETQKVTPGRQRSPETGSQAPQRGNTDIVALGKLAQRLGLNVGEHPEFGGVDPVHTQGSYHYNHEGTGGGSAIDVSGDPALMRKYARIVARRYGSDLEELIWRGAGARTKKQGRHVPKHFYTGHQDHVHVADDD